MTPRSRALLKQVLKLSDFGLARARPEGVYDMTGNTGTKRYMAPEVFRKEKDYGTGVDVYSAAIIMWMMCTGLRPWESINADEVAIQSAGHTVGGTPMHTQYAVSGAHGEWHAAASF